MACLLIPLASLARDFHPEILSALRYLEDSQVRSQGVYEIGEWPTQVTAVLLPSLIGAGKWGKPYQEPTIFTTATIVNLLNSIYKDSPELSTIPPMIERAIDGFGGFSEGPFFNFYPLKNYHGTWVRGPRSMPLAPYLQGLAHIPPDADTTSVTYLALQAPVPEKVISAFSRFRDQNRKSHHYNRLYSNINTGAFMTWLMDEKDPAMPRGTGHPELGPRIPFGTNDVDCIINANILKLLTAQKRTEVPGYLEACTFLKESIRYQHYNTCGIYYPNDYILPFRVGELKALGARCLSGKNSTVLQFILDTQNLDGSWNSTPPNRPDPINSTALALNSLLLLGNLENRDHRVRVHNAVNFLLENGHRDRQGNLYWNGQVFFSAIAEVRYSVIWRSNSYTTALVARALQLAENF